MRSRREVALDGIRERSRGAKRLVADVPDHQAIGAERLLVEEDARPQAERFVQRAVQHLVVAGDVDTELADEAFGDGAVGLRAVDGLRAAVSDIGAAVVTEFVPLGVAAEVVMVVEHEHARVGPGLPVGVGGRQPADAGPDHHQVVLFARVRRGARGLPERATVPQGVERFERADVRSAQPGERGRIGRALCQQRVDVDRQPAARHRRADADGDAVEEVAAGDAASHAEPAVVRCHGAHSTALSIADCQLPIGAFIGRRCNEALPHSRLGHRVIAPTPQ